MRRLCLAPLLFAATPLAAHPHIFVDAALYPAFDAAGQLAAVRVVWMYDEAYSALIFEDYGLDADGDGKLTEAEREALTGFDMNWIDGFNGDLVATRGTAVLGLGGPEEATLDVMGGQIVTTHLRRFDTPVPAQGGVSFSVYDASFYTAYTLSLGARVEGRDDCRTEIVMPDAEAAYAILHEALAAFDDIALAEGDFPAVGAAFAHDLHLTCNPPS